MSAVFWLKSKYLLENIKRMAVFLLLPILLLIIMKFININTNIIIAYFSLNVTLLTTLVLYSVDDLVTAEAVLGANITIKELWKANIIFTVVLSYVYSWIILIIAYVILGKYFTLVQVSYYAVIQNLISPILSCGLIGCATLYYCDYSLSKQYAASPFAMVYFILPLLSITKGNILPVNIYSILIELSGILLYMLSRYFIEHSNSEKLLINSSRMISIIKNNDDTILDE